MTHKNILYYLY